MAMNASQPPHMFMPPQVVGRNAMPLMPPQPQVVGRNAMPMMPVPGMFPMRMSRQPMGHPHPLMAPMMPQQPHLPFQYGVPPNHNIQPFIHGQNLYHRHQPPMQPAFGGGHANARPIPIPNNVSEQSMNLSKSAPVSRQRPDGPHNLSNNSKYGSGAFIPLQAARKNVKPKANTLNAQPIDVKVN